MKEILDILLVVFAVPGVVLITNRSSIFKPVREWVRNEYKKRPDRWVLWFLDSILQCPLCMSVWAAMFCLAIMLSGLGIVLTIPCAVTVNTLVFKGL